MELKLWHGFAAVAGMFLVLLGVNLCVMLLSYDVIKDESNLQVFLRERARLTDSLSWGGLISEALWVISWIFSH